MGKETRNLSWGLKKSRQKIFSKNKKDAAAKKQAGYFSSPAPLKKSRGPAILRNKAWRARKGAGKNAAEYAITPFHLQNHGYLHREHGASAADNALFAVK